MKGANTMKLEFHQSINKLADWVQKSCNTVVFTGAGMSTESGIPDFRSDKGLWTKTDPMQVATVESMYQRYDLFHEFYTLRIENVRKSIPHEGHKILAQWEREKKLTAIATQNVDRYHHLAGNKNVYELHGSLETIRCIEQGHSSTSEAFINKKPCSKCGSLLRPGVVLFGEMLPHETWSRALHCVQESDLLLIIGTSLQVHPVNQLPSMSKGKVVLINREDVRATNVFDLVLKGSAGQILQQVNQVLKGEKIK